jgi:hypothetical protein
VTPDKLVTIMFIAVRILNLVQWKVSASFLKGLQRANNKCRKMTVAGKALNLRKKFYILHLGLQK